ncbi:hypothetical protein HDV05_001215 [Chytridiales sp. JEL 0842]|nr:hypothetical protein HDV05_001215 [Chytridiales sp. JEL 0842]
MLGIRKPLSVLFFGSDEFSIICCDRIARAVGGGTASIISHLGIVTPPDNFRTKHPEVPLKAFARSNQIPYYTAPPKTLKGWEPPRLGSKLYDLGVVVSFGYFLPSPLIRSFKYGALNVHPSLLPRYRGAAPIQHTILNGDKETGVSIIELHEKEWDAGRILKQSVMPVPEDVMYKDLHDSLAKKGADDLVETISNFDHYLVNAKTQVSSEVSKAPKISKDMAIINWSDMSALRIFTLHRALGYKIPLTTTFRGKRVQLLDIMNPKISIKMDEESKALPPVSAPFGSFFYDKRTKTLLVRCADGWLRVVMVKVEGKREQGMADFANGYQLSHKSLEVQSVDDNNRFL